MSLCAVSANWARAKSFLFATGGEVVVGEGEGDKVEG